MDDLLADECIALDSTGRIGRDLSCLQCGYNLRTLQPEGICPECGLPIFQSIRGDRLKYSDPEWVAKLARGARWIFAGIVCYYVLGNVGQAVRSLRTATGIGILAVFLPAFWWYTSPEPNRTDPERALCLRRLARMVSLAGFLLIPLLTLVGMETIRIGGKFTFAPGGNRPDCRLAAAPGIRRQSRRTNAPPQTGEGYAMGSPLDGRRHLYRSARFVDSGLATDRFTSFQHPALVYSGRDDPNRAYISLVNQTALRLPQESHSLCQVRPGTVR